MQRADLPSGLQRRVLAELDPPARLALFRTSHALARTVLVHAPSGKRLIKLASGVWPPPLALLLDDPLLQPLADLDLFVEGGADLELPPPSPPPPPPSIARHVARLQLFSLTLTPSSLAAWRLHDPRLWPHLRHLAIAARTPPPTPAPAQPLQPIPRLLTFAWCVTVYDAGDDDPASQAAVLPLAARARHLRFLDPHWHDDRTQATPLRALAHLRRLTTANLDVSGSLAVLEALLRHPTLEDVTVSSVPHDLPDLSQRACRWRTLTVSAWASIASLPHLPLAGLERLTIAGCLAPSLGGGASVPAMQAGLALLQRLHSQGKLVLRASDAQDQHWRLPPEEGVFALRNLGDLTPAALRLVLEAGQGVTALLVNTFVLLAREDDLAPLRERPAHGVNTLCVRMEVHDVLFRWGALLGRLPAPITHLVVDASDFGGDPYVDAVMAGCLRDLVKGGASALRRPVTLTVLLSGLISAELEAELVALTSGAPVGPAVEGADGERREQQQSFLTLRVVRTDPEQA